MIKKVVLSIMITLCIWVIVYILVCQDITNYLNHNIVYLNHDFVNRNFSFWQVFTSAAFYDENYTMFVAFVSDYIPVIILAPALSFIFFKFTE